ncbi:MAG: lipoyl(octanoyl) transferase LipB [Bacteroidota bacterium]
MEKLSTFNEELSVLQEQELKGITVQERVLDYSDTGMIDYDTAWKLQKHLFEERHRGNVNDTLLLLEHPHTYTLGKTADKSNLTCTPEYLREKGISVFDIDRGGDITYHGPGQIVGYPVINLNEWHADAHLYLRSLEEVIIRTLGQYGLKTGRIEGLTGVWIENRKIAAIGIKISRWITMHGFALNVSTDLDYFGGIIPCGIRDKEVTSLNKELQRDITVENVKEKLLDNFKHIFSYDRIACSTADVKNRIAELVAASI